MKQQCSYCQREYGTLSIGNKPIFRTMDHIEAFCKTRDKKRNGGGMSSTRIQDLEMTLQCCNECNELKSHYHIEDFSSRLNHLLRYKSRYKQASYLTSKLVKTMRYSINILLTTTTEPLPLDFINQNILNYE